MRHLKILEGRKSKCISKNYTPEQLKKLQVGDVKETVQGLQDMLDISKLVKRITPEQIKQLKEKQLNGNYGVQSNDSVRDVMQKSIALKKDFSSLPALIREHFENDEFAYLDFVEKNKENKYALAELSGEILKSEKFNYQLEKHKKQEQSKKDEDALKQQQLADLIKQAVAPEQGSK